MSDAPTASSSSAQQAAKSKKKTPTERFFDEQRAAHGSAKGKILASYLQGWFGKLGNNKWSDYRHLFVVDAFAGCGAYASEQPGAERVKGSPLVALDAFLSMADKMPQVDCVVFFFAEGNRAYFAQLEQNLAPYRKDARYVEWSQVNAKVASGDKTKFTFRTENVAFEDEAHPIAKMLRKNRTVPVFSFLDPFGYKMLHMSQVAKFLASDKAEVLINFNMSGLPRAVGGARADDGETPSNGAASATASTAASDTNKTDAEAKTKQQQRATSDANLNNLFGNDEWLAARDDESLTPSGRRRVLVNAYKESLKKHGGARYTTEFAMRNARNNWVYFLVYATKHEKGLDLMKNHVMRPMINADSTEGMSFSSFDCAKNKQVSGLWLEECANDIIDHFIGQKGIAMSAVKDFVTKHTCWPFQLSKMKVVMEKRGIAWTCRLAAMVDFRKATIKALHRGDDDSVWKDASLAADDDNMYEDAPHGNSEDKDDDDDDDDDSAAGRRAKRARRSDSKKQSAR